LSLDDTISYVEDESKYRHIYVRRQYEWEKPETDVAIILANVICHSYYGN